MADAARAERWNQLFLKQQQTRQVFVTSRATSPPGLMNGNEAPHAALSQRDALKLARRAVS